jgi:predicted DCC family thiol-disulfide oxidoreductase YuxK
MYRGEPIPDRLILFDGVCNFCSANVRFVIQRDPEARFQFASLQSDVGQYFAKQYGFANLESMVLLQQGRIYQKSSAALRVARQLTGLWPLLFAFIAVPRPVRDGVYDFIGNRRYQWFGKTEECWVPNADIRSRFFRDAGG